MFDFEQNDRGQGRGRRVDRTPWFGVPYPSNIARASVIPFRTNMTAMAANSRLATLESVFAPVRPMARVMDSEDTKTSPASAILATTAAAVSSLPWIPASRRHVVSTAGPLISGTPIGTAPRLSRSVWRCFFSPVRRSLNEIASSRMPPAIMKSATVMPRNLKRTGPKARKTNATVDAVITDWTMTILSRALSIPSVRERNNGNTPTASTATNSGTKHNQNAFILFPAERQAQLPLYSASGIAVRWSDWLCKCAFLYSLPTTTQGRIFSSFLGPIPFTLSKSSTVL
jgi:hypothetical protein